MSESQPPIPENRRLPGSPSAADDPAVTTPRPVGGARGSAVHPVGSAGGTGAGSDTVAGGGTHAITSNSPARQLAELPPAELDALAVELGLQPVDFDSRPALVAAVHGRRQMIAGLDRDAMMDVIRWGRRPVLANASREDLAREIAQIRSMRFHGLSHPGLIVLAKLRGVNAAATDATPEIVKRLKKQEGLLAKLGRKRRAWVGSVVAGILGEPESGTYQYVPPADGSRPAASSASRSSSSGGASRSASIKDDIEESGLLGGLTNRIKKTADNYLNQKLDEVEARIDRKLDEIDRRLGDWRDKEIANRIRILKITLWASVVVAAVSLIYAYVREYAQVLLSTP